MPSPLLVWLNGSFVSHDEATISLFDAGFQHAIGLFETMAARNGRVFRPEAHVQRLARSAKELRLSDSLRERALVEAVQLALDRNELAAARIRLTITGGNLAAPIAQSSSIEPDEAARNQTGRTGGGQDPTIAIVVQPPTQYPEAFYEKGIVVTIADGRMNPLDPMTGHKTLNYWSRIRALQDAGLKGAGEAIWFTVSNHLASGSVSNIFLVKDAELHTPIAHAEEEPSALHAPVLPGITRDAVLESADAQGIAVHKRMLDIDDVLQADEVFFTNASWGVLPVIAVEREPIAAGKVGAVTQQFRAAWLEKVERETGDDG